MSCGISQSVYRPEERGWSTSEQIFLVRLPSRLYQFARYGLIAGAAGIPVLILILAVTR